MTEGFLWGGINIKKLCRLFVKNFWIIIVVMIITYLGLGLVSESTNPSYSYTAVAAVYPTSEAYRYHTIENVTEISAKTSIVGSILNSDIFQSEFHNQYPDFQDCQIEFTQIENTDLLVIHASTGSPEKANEGIEAALDCYSRFSGNMIGSSEIKIIFKQKVPNPNTDSSKIQSNRPMLSILSGLMIAGIILLMHVAKKTYKTEGFIKKRYKNVRFFSLPLYKGASENKKGFFSKKNNRPPITKLSLEIKQFLHKYNKKTLFVTSYADPEGGSAFLSELAGELAEQNENVLLIGTETLPHDADPGSDSSDDMKKYTLLDVLQQKSTVKDVVSYREELKVHFIQFGIDCIDENVSYTVDDARRVLVNCLEYADIVLIDGTSWYPSHFAQIWNDAADASIALCRQEDADFFKVDQMLNHLQNSSTSFAGCVLSDF